MANADRLGIARIQVDGAWDVADLLALAESLSESYGLFYPLVAEDDTTRDRLHDQLRRTFWSGDMDSRHIGRELYRQIPIGESLKLRSFIFSSPGYLEIFGALSCIGMLSRIANAWIKTATNFVDLWAKVDKFFEHRKHLRKPKRKTILDDDLAIGADEARMLCFEIGGNLGFDPLSCERIIAVVGNPIAALKYLVAAGNEGRKLAQLQNADLLKFPETEVSIPIQPPKGGDRRGRSGVVVETRRRKHKPN
jgi:hypothetical protein